ncbi:glycosyltransferase family 2 protein [Lyngbya sp. PCC 8106]|uniref:glycosyltransferase family 2 protein n=1 Tax=Lyngbya sp. (strain PCC 8106) TaxID=313612 RepID=UPI0000EAD1BC|nr:glycosyltransferase [Lyngbya sp. PCC 8106]EAW38325.1 probable glucosyltransferase [Lyngbya sp. PCC 8106]
MLVSILINNYNYGHFVSDAIDSALSQTYSDVEIILVDDGSTDNSCEIITSYQNKITTIFKENGGQASAFNVGFAKSQGDIICFLDADDVFLPEKVTQIVNCFEHHQEIGWCFHPLRYATEDLLAYSETTIHTGKSGVYDVRPYIQRGKLRDYIPFQGTVTSGLCFTRKLLQQILPMPEEIRITSDDYLKYSAFGISPGFILLQDLALQRIHGNNAYTMRKDKQELRAKIEMLTAYHLRENIPYISKFSHNIFAMGLSKYQPLKLDNESHEILIKNYFLSLSFYEKLEINLRSLYHRMKQVNLRRNSGEKVT